VGKDGVELETQYRRILEQLGKMPAIQKAAPANTSPPGP
jgi:hypothetical protein